VEVETGKGAHALDGARSLISAHGSLLSDAETSPQRAGEASGPQGGNSLKSRPSGSNCPPSTMMVVPVM
jgi:hypothetical protein